MSRGKQHAVLTERIGKAKAVAMQYGGIDGDHHKQWVIDQMVRILCGHEDHYQGFIQVHNMGEDGPNTYEWEEGIAP